MRSPRTWSLALLGLALVGSAWCLIDAPLDKEVLVILNAEQVEYDAHPLNELAERVSALAPEWDLLHQKCYGESYRECLRWIRGNREAVSLAMPDETFFELYDAILAQDQFRFPDLTHPGASTGIQQAFIRATRVVILSDVADLGYVKPMTLERLIRRHRHHLVQGHVLIDWMILNATMGMLVDAATRTVQTVNIDGHPLMSALRPLTLKEHSARRVLEAELQYMNASIQELAPDWWYKTNHWTNVMWKVHKNAIHASEQSHEAFWASTFEPYRFSLSDRLFDPIGWAEHYYEHIFYAAYHDYFTTVRLTDIGLALVRALARTEPSDAPKGWRWHRSETSLCLIPDPAATRYAGDSDSPLVCGEIVEP